MDNLGIREFLGKSGHIEQIGPREAAAKLRRQLSPHCGDNFLPVFRPLLFEHVRSDAVADGPVEQDQSGIHGAGDLFPRTEDDLAQVSHE